MYKLLKKEYKKIQPLLKEVTHSKAIVYATLEHNHDGGIYVDRKVDPRVAFIITKVNYFYILGNADYLPVDFYHFVLNHIQSKSSENEMIVFTYSQHNKVTLDRLFEEKNVITIERVLFRLNNTKFKSVNSITIPEGYEIYSHKDHLNTGDCITEPMNKEQFGFSLYRGKKRISTCYAIFEGGLHVEIDIRTEEPYRNKGFGKMIATLFIEECFKYGLTPDFACWPYNKASINMAKSLGFEEITPCIAHYYSGESEQ
ncbi:GNAT family N-acetyltransferase [Haloplasma contractile]|uniref:Phospholipiddiacylglycerol acyltransferase protein n=1 Tax=Haloplasma contractile SSD-17B TaxID=1033810 RepID=F7PRI0_9MOLU|nr:GNAT family N-acetyltransferase [Haloplasma contractile]ERJ11693.1 phospholipiddiacylglycerol acyltransferase protein [Haloplasma contractile SSD-17B]